MLNYQKHPKHYMQLKLYITLLVLLALKSSLTAQPPARQWVNFKIDSTTGFFSFSSMAVDLNGNSYLAGYESDEGDEYYETHLVLLKVNAAGKFQWKRTFNNIKDSIDEAIDVATDAAGYIYVTGRRMDTFCNICTYNTKISDIITMKYDGAGNRIWLNRYHNAPYILAEPADISLAKDGTILITGNERQYKSDIGTYVSKLLIQKINKNGKTAWVKKMDSVVGHSGCFDKNGNVLIAGASNPASLYQAQKPMLLKFRPSGTLFWSDVFDEYGKNGRLYFVGCDAQNNIYTNGQTDTLAFYNNPRIITLKYNAAGQRLWFRKEVNQTTTMPHVFGDFKIDNAGNSYLAGYVSKTSVDDDWIISKYDKAGRKKWSKTVDNVYHGSDKPFALAIDSKKNVFASGYVYGSGNYAIATAGYKPNGDSLLFDIYKRNNSNGFPAGIGIDKNDNAYTGGMIGFYNNPNPSSVVIKYGIKNPVSIAEENTIKLNELSLYPNPVVNTLNISFMPTLGVKKYNLIIHDISGNPVLTKQINNSGTKFINLNIDVNSLKHGVYKVSITDGVNLVSKTFIKE